MTCALLAGVLSASALAQSEFGKLTASDAASEDQFGFSLSMSGDQLIVGAPLGDKSKFSDSGAAYVFVRDTAHVWSERAKLTPHDAAHGDGFGGAVGISGSYAIAGAPRHDHIKPNAGAAYVFHRSKEGWSEQAELLADDACEGDLFGFAVSTDGDCAVVGAYRVKKGSIADSGAAYVFARRGDRWVQTAKLTPASRSEQEWFGRAVAVGGDYVVVGATGSDEAAPDAGAVFIYQREGAKWLVRAVLRASDAAANDRFGRSVAIDGDRIVVGAFWQDGVGADSGAAYVFHRRGDRWTEEAKFTALNAAADDLFGISVDISGDYAVVGAIHQDEAGEDAGAAYFFKRLEDRWIQPFRVTSSAAGAQDWFGFSVAIDGMYAAVGAIRDDDDGFDSGSVDLYSVVTIELPRRGGGANDR